MHSLAAWVAHLADRLVSFSTIKSYLTGLKSAHIDIGFVIFDDSFFHPMLQRVVAGIRKLRGEANTHEREPLTRGLLLRVLPLLDTSTQYGATLHAAFCLAFAGFLRIGEFTYSKNDLSDPEFDRWHITRGSVTLHKDHMELSLPSSKTDPFRRGILLTIAAADDDACPVRSLRHLLERFPTDSLSAPLFFTSSREYFTRQFVIDTLRALLARLGIDGHFSGHSFRRGAATWARIAGLSEEEIMLLGRWKSDSWRLYVKTHPSYIIAVSRRHQRRLPSASLATASPGAPLGALGSGLGSA